MRVIDLVREFCMKNGDKYSVYENYSGRGMFNEICPGIIVSAGNSYLKMIADLVKFFGEHEFDDAYMEFDGMSVDCLGLDTIVYFPNMRC